MPERTLERLKVAFALEITRNIVNADQALHPKEIEMVFKAFPAHKLEALGFLEPGGDEFTLAYHQAVRDAKVALPRALTVPEKEDFIAWFKEVCAADGHVDKREDEMVAQASLLLGLPPRI
jgi:uncharacterized tellurite resistance protein B-like protein